MRNQRHALKTSAWLVGLLVITGCRHPLSPTTVQNEGEGDEIIAAGKRFHTGTRVITWLDPAGYDGYKNVSAFGRRRGLEKSKQPSTESKHEDFLSLQKAVDQLVLHYDGHGLSRTCFAVLGERGLSVHFMLDLDGTVYQTLDLQERASHATTANDRSIGVELANLGAFPPGETKATDEWYHHDLSGTYIQIPVGIAESGIYTKSFVGRPMRPDLIRGSVQGMDLIQYDLTAEQYAALIKLTAALCELFPRIKRDYPRDAAGQLINYKLRDEELAKYQGILGHYHIQANKTDPGPAFQWDKLVEASRQSTR